MHTATSHRPKNSVPLTAEASGSHQLHYTVVLSTMSLLFVSSAGNLFFGMILLSSRCSKPNGPDPFVRCGSSDFQLELLHASSAQRPWELEHANPRYVRRARKFDYLSSVSMQPRTCVRTNFKNLVSYRIKSTVRREPSLQQ